MADIPRAQDQLFDRRSSARDKYSRLVIGRPGWGPLLQHEFITLLSQNVPGALGLALRKTLYPSLLGACGRGVVFGQNVVLRHPHKIKIGDDVVIDDNCLIDAKGESNQGITIGSGVFVGRNSILSCKNGDIVLAAYVYVIGGDHDAGDPSIPVGLQARRSQGVDLGRGAWIGAGAKVLDGVSVGDGAVIGAGAVVREAVPAQAIAVGVPARVVGTRDETREATSLG
jgi:acetyltransferase-like isoleucine patch superfamily enzyme